MDRRQFVRVAGVGLGAATGFVGGSVANAQAKVRAKTTADVVVVGAGVFGVWSAYHLSRNGVRVILVDV